MLQEQAKAAHKVTLIGAVLDAVLGIAKILIGWISNSHALIADGIHSLSDLLTDALVVIVTHYGRQEPDKDHPYGHARFETMGTLVLGSLLIAVAGAISYDSLIRLWQADNFAIPGWPGLVVAAASILGKEWIFHYTMRVARKIKSDLLVANAWHSRSDALSSIVVFIGIGGTMLGYQWLDQVAALIVGLMVAHIGWKLMADSIRELVDTALPEEETREMLRHAESINCVKAIHSLRTRKMGSQVFLDIHIEVNPRISVSEGHQIGVQVTQLIREHHPEVADVTFHIDAEDDSDNSLPPLDELLPLREEIIEQLQYAWRSLPIEFQANQLVLHYLNNRIDIDLYLADCLPVTLTEAILKQHLEDKAWLGQLRVWQRS